MDGYDGFEKTALWRVLDEKATDEQKVTVRRLARHAAATLDRVIESFPTYTLHDHVHAENVAGLMGDVLGDRVDDLTALEAAMLLLGAYWHDIGMVFRPDERASLRDEVDFARFLDEHPAAFVAAKEGMDAGDELPLDVAEWYCRWRHADRVFVHLDRLPAEHLLWGSISLREPLGRLCRSHNYGGDVVRELRTDLAVDCDLRFCAVVLRLADILDFDRSRSPDAVYDHLGLGAGSTGTPRERASDVEWRKHLCAEGFRFPVDRPRAYTIDFVAGPTDPTVEHDVRQFLDVIEAEMGECAALATGCSPRWRELPLPGRVDRRNILSQGYKYGEHRFTLDREQVLQLFMGENLYESPFTFVRELLQNAIDASRHREFYERSRGRSGYEAPPIVVDDWTDRDGYRWVRFDDAGMGMSEEIVVDYFLKVGRSYYRSAAFQADLLRYAERGTDFMPISRFGIGVLSCFMAGDRVEVSTRRVEADGTHPDPVRLSLTSMEGLYVLQTGDMRPADMPGPAGSAAGYRTTPGTTIAVRLDPRKERHDLDVAALLDGYVLCPPVRIEHAGRVVGEHDDALVDEPWCEPETFALPDDFVEEVERVLDCELPDGLHLEVLPLDLTAASPDPRLRGQMVAVCPMVTGLTGSGSSSVPWNAAGMRAEIERDGVTVTLPTPSLDGVISCTVKVAAPWFRRVADARGRRRTWLQSREPDLSHNGVRLHLPPRAELGPDGKPAPLTTLVRTVQDLQGRTVGQVALADGLRPDVPLSREELSGLPWHVFSALHLAGRRAVRQAGRLRVEADLFGLGRFFEAPTVAVALEDPLLVAPDGWRSERLFATQAGMRSVDELLADCHDGRPAVVVQRERSMGFDSFLDHCRRALLHLHTTTRMTCSPGGKWSYLVGPADRCAGAGRQQRYEPLSFVPYESWTNLLKARGQPVNAAHPFARWLLAATDELHERLPASIDTLEHELHWIDQAFDIGEAVDRIDQTVRRIGEVAPDLAPPDGVRVTERDIG